MLFQSFSFVVFIVVFFILYFLPYKGKIKWQNLLLLMGSYFFYGYVEVKMLPLLLLTTTLFYFLAKLISKNAGNKGRQLALVGVIIGVGLLFYYKYFNFFVNSVNQLFIFLNITQANWRGNDIIMPLGISFFTFKLISYIVEVNRGKIEPINDFVAFAAYIAFFPTIMSGPIDRPNNFLHQLKKYHNIDYNMVVDGCKQILWGTFQKLVIADNIAIYTTHVWNNIEISTGSTLLFALILFSFQLYADFSGYSDMAIGIGKLFGFNITKNFNYPFFAVNIAEFWRRWHISLTSWITDYVFIPLNITFRNLANLGMILAIVINMFLVGLWHGANLTFVVFGLYHGLLFIPLILSGSFLKRANLKINKYGLPLLSDFLKMSGTFLLVTISLIIFNAKDLGQAYDYFNGIFSMSIFSLPNRRLLPNVILFLLCLLIVLEWIYKKDEYAIKKIGLRWKRPYRYAFYYSIIFAIFLFGGKEQQFIYFQF